MINLGCTQSLKRETQRDETLKCNAFISPYTGMINLGCTQPLKHDAERNEAFKGNAFCTAISRVTLSRLFPPPFVMSDDSDLGYPDVKLFTIVDSLVSVIRESSVACRFMIVIYGNLWYFFMRHDWYPIYKPYLSFLWDFWSSFFCIFKILPLNSNFTSISSKHLWILFLHTFL